MPQTVWDSSPVCEFLKCAFWPKDTEKVNTSVKHNHFHKSRTRCKTDWGYNAHQKKFEYTFLEYDMSLWIYSTAFNWLDFNKEWRGKLFLSGSKGNRFQHLSSCNSAPSMRQNSVPTCSGIGVKSVSCLLISCKKKTIVSSWILTKMPQKKSKYTLSRNFKNWLPLP